MKIGTKSVLFGVHQFAIHPWFVALAWWRLYGFPFNPLLWIAFFVHDLGYYGKPNMDGTEGEEHPEFAARLMNRLFDHPKNPEGGRHWFFFCLLHSRFYSKRLGLPFSRLCVADKLALSLTPRWLYLIQSNLTGEIHEYMHGTGARSPAGNRSQWQWLTDVQNHCKKWALEHVDGKPDSWTGSKRDLAISRSYGGEQS